MFLESIPCDLYFNLKRNPSPASWKDLFICRYVAGRQWKVLSIVYQSLSLQKTNKTGKRSNYLQRLHIETVKHLLQFPYLMKML